VDYKMEWVRHHDRYEPAPAAKAGGSVPARHTAEDRSAGTRESIMASYWPWLAVAGVGALHGLNPASGWMFAAAWVCMRAIGAGAAGPDADCGRHATSIALVAGAFAIQSVDGSRFDASPGGRTACRHRDLSLVGPHKAGADAGRDGRAGALFLHDVQCARAGLMLVRC